MPPDLGLAEVELLGRELGEALRPGEVVWLEGELGAGKTTLVQSIASGLGVAEFATSPTYNLVHRYEGRRGPVFHVDCYRLRVPDEAAELGWERLALADAVLIEWPHRAGAWALPPTRRIRLAHTTDPDRRRVEVIAS
ncbi:MAG: tRNA (adenosine(37)-N6)-threonylcarbamoyltransferase complex ATPase subunit type 1 TsaE [Gemmatimonadetes bacterium]|nr:tRNA (adenosine(37)-N6)-threonylcarbamoyltransferase complex ATPase subunit type 1 TsaE [Gemmatimonadota bacterium]